MALPLWLLKVLSPCLAHSSTRMYSCLFLTPVVIISLILIIEGLVTWRLEATLTGVIVGAVGVVLIILVVNFELWSMMYRHIPNEDDVDRVSISAVAEAAPGSDGSSVSEQWNENREDNPERDPEECLPLHAPPGAPRPPERADLIANDGSWFKDSLGRRVLLRGISVTGCCKLPKGVVPDEGSDRQLGSEGWKKVTFVGRPFDLDNGEADIHLARLRSWGMTFIRLLYTWEAMEHAGPGEYDEEYIAYIVALCRKCREYGISVFLDCHQDCWSRFTGGSGAPAWTLLKVGFDLDKLEESGAAFTDRGLYSKEGGGEGIPRMAWNANNARAAAGTMWTLFFAGNDFAPQTMIDGQTAQDYLQGKFCAMLARLAEAVKDEPNVVGFDVLNEPSVGFVRVHDARDISRNEFLIGWRVDVWSAIKLAAGFSCSVDYFGSFMVWNGKKVLNPDGVSAWQVATTDQSGADACIWRKNGVWDLNGDGQPVLKDPQYFAKNPKTGAEIDFMDDYAIPFYDKALRAIRKHMPDAIIFLEPVIDMTDPGMSEQPVFTEEQAGSHGLVWAKHFYDGMTLLSANFSRWVNANPVTQTPLAGLGNIQRSFGKTLANFKEESSKMGPRGAPVLVGECGIPFNMKSNRRFRDMSPCTAAMDTTLRALEIGLVSATIWTYCHINTNLRGDDWNGEDLSLWSQDHVTDPNDLHSGGRSLAAAVRPYALRTAGTPLSMEFLPYRKDRRFTFSFRSDMSLSTNETIIFLPKYQYPHGAVLIIKQGNGEYSLESSEQTLVYRHQGEGTHTLVVTKIQKK